MVEDCIFCKIVEDKVPSHKVYEDENVIAFLDVNPVSKGHTLVAPKEHVETIYEAEGMDYLWDAVVKVSNALREAYDPDGLNLAMNNGEIAGQEVMHMHMHVTPRYTGDELEIEYNRKELDEGDEIAEEIRSEIS